MVMSPFMHIYMQILEKKTVSVACWIYKIPYIEVQFIFHPRVAWQMCVQKSNERQYRCFVDSERSFGIQEFPDFTKGTNFESQDLS